MNHSNLKKNFNVILKSCLNRKLCSLSRQSRIMLHLNINACPLPDFVIRHASYCYIQVDLENFLASEAFFLGREATERATTS